jgi:hypothetical protein
MCFQKRSIRFKTGQLGGATKVPLNGVQILIPISQISFVDLPPKKLFSSPPPP